LASHFFENPQYDEYDEYFPQDNYYNNEFDDFIGGEFDQGFDYEFGPADFDADANAYFSLAQN